MLSSVLASIMTALVVEITLIAKPTRFSVVVRDIVVPLTQFPPQPQVLAIEPPARVNQISLKDDPAYLKDTAVTFYVMFTEKT